VGRIWTDAEQLDTMKGVSLLKKLHLSASLILVVAGLSIIAADAVYFAKYGVGFNEAAFFLGNGEFVDWATGECPLYAYFPLAAYGIGACLAAIVLFSVSPEIRAHSGRVLRGTE